MIRTLVVLVGGIWGACVACGAERKEVGPLTPEDFVVAGIVDGADTADVHELLGGPDSVVTRDNPFDREGSLAVHFYQDLTVHFGYSGLVLGATLTGPTFATHRGLRVGDAQAQVLELYGEPEYRSDDEWEFTDPKDPEGLHVVRLEFTASRISEIYVGWLLD